VVFDLRGIPLPSSDVREVRRAKDPIQVQTMRATVKSANEVRLQYPATDNLVAGNWRGVE
jgi:hypothetical protein